NGGRCRAPRRLDEAGAAAPAAGGKDLHGGPRRVGPRGRAPAPRRGEADLMAGILTFAEQRGGTLRKAALEAISQAARIYEGGPVTALVVGSGISEAAAAAAAA